LALPIKYLSIIRWIIRKIIKFLDLSRGDRQAQEKKKNGEHSTHGSILESMVAPKPTDLNVIACPEKMTIVTGQIVAELRMHPIG
jgi:hypothetical protein